MPKLRILHLFNSYLPQTENWAYHLIKNTPEVEIYIGANHYLKNNFYHPDFHFIDNYYDEFRKVNRHLSKKSPFEFVQKLVIKAIPFMFGRTEQKIIDYAIDNKIELIHAHFADVGWQFLEVAQKTGLPYIISFYGWDYEKLPFTKPEYNTRFKILFKQAKAFICEGKHGADILENLGCAEEKIHIVSLGIEAKEIPIHKRFKVSDELNLIQVASFTEKKGHIYTVTAFAEARKTCPNMHLTLVGGSSNSKVKMQINQFIKENNLAQKVTILPPIEFSQLHYFLKDFHVFIHPSCYAEDHDCEGGAPVVFLDAQATGMPVISTRHCDIPSEIIHTKTGLLSEEKDISAIAENIKVFYKMENAAYQVYCENARNHVEHNFDCCENAEKLLSTYIEMLKNSKHDS